MIWSFIFIISIAQALFVLSLLVTRKSNNPAASLLMAAMLIIMMLPNLNYFSVTSGLYNRLSFMFGISFGSLFILGPLFYFYTKTITDSHFKFRWIHLLHFIPYLIYCAFNYPFFVMPHELKLYFIRLFISGSLLVVPLAYFVFIAQAFHFGIYLYFSVWLIRGADAGYSDRPFIIPIEQRSRWLKQLLVCFIFFLLSTLSYIIYLLFSLRYNPVINYSFTLITSSVIYFIAYKLILNPGLISPNFNQKYKTYKPFNGAEGECYLQRLEQLMHSEKIFINPDLNLALLSKEMGLPAHLLSKLVNEKFQKSFTDYINEYRVKEFIHRVKASDFNNLSIYGIALDVGFNSKSSFNCNFKKFTGKTPSELKKGL